MNHAVYLAKTQLKALNQFIDNNKDLDKPFDLKDILPLKQKLQKFINSDKTFDSTVILETCKQIEQTLFDLAMQKKKVLEKHVKKLT